MLGKILATISLLSLLLTSSSHASVIFNFTIDDLGQDSSNATLGDTFTFTFFDDTNFGNGITGSDIESISLNSQVLGSAEFQISSCGAVCVSGLNQIFKFTDLGHSVWQLDITVGNTGIDAFVTLNDSAGVPEIQLAQNDGATGFTTFTLQTGFQLNTQFQFISFASGPYVFSASSNSVNAPNSLVLALCVLVGLYAARRRLLSR